MDCVPPSSPNKTQNQSLGAQGLENIRTQPQAYGIHYSHEVSLWATACGGVGVLSLVPTYVPAGQGAGGKGHPWPRCCDALPLLLVSTAVDATLEGSTMWGTLLGVCLSQP